MKLEINGYGFCLDSDWFYVALSWQVLATAVGIYIAIKLYRKYS